MNNRCVCCNEIIPEGRLVCPSCENHIPTPVKLPKWCPLKRNSRCDMEECAWWYEGLKCCAIVGIAKKI